MPDLMSWILRDKVKEAETIKLKQAPKEANGFAKWAASSLDEVVAASGRSGACYTWYSEIEDPDISFEQLSIPGESGGRSWEPFDDKLRVAVNKCAEGELSKTLLRKSEEYRKEFRKLIRGRQLMRIVYKYYQANGQMKQVYGLKELSNVELRNDDLEAFQNEWLRVLNGQRDPSEISPGQKQELFWLQVKTSKRMAQDISHYRRVGVGMMITLMSTS